MKNTVPYDFNGTHHRMSFDEFRSMPSGKSWREYAYGEERTYADRMQHDIFLLMRFTDAKIGEIVRLSGSHVRVIRSRMNLPRKRVFLDGWSTDEDALLLTMCNRNVADATGRTMDAVRNRRKRMKLFYNPEPDMVTTDEAAEKTGQMKSYIHYLISMGKVSGDLKRQMVSLASLNAHLETRKRKAA